MTVVRRTVTVRRAGTSRRRLLAVIGTAAALAQPARAAEFAAELVGTPSVVQVTPGSTASFTIDLTASGSIRCGQTATTRVKTTMRLALTATDDRIAAEVERLTA